MKKEETTTRRHYLRFEYMRGVFFGKKRNTYTIPVSDFKAWRTIRASRRAKATLAN